MRGVFEDQEPEPVQAGRDAELTLGSGTLLAIGFGLLVLCGLCFGLGYTMGHRGSASPASTQPVVGGQPVESSSIAKPSAMPQIEQASSPAPVDPGQAASAAGTIAPAGAAQTVPALAQSAAPGQPQIQPALTPAVETTQPGQAGANAVRPAFSPAAQPVAGSLMVQIAAVSNAEDANVLTNALRQRGYSVTVRREPIDNLIHVRIGPFGTPAEANTWRVKLLNDGYNAIVQ